MLAVARIRKAIVAGVGAGIAAYTAGAADGAVSPSEWALVVGSAIVVAAATWRVPNKAAE